MHRIEGSFWLIIICLFAVTLEACLEGPPPTKEEAMEAVASFKTGAGAGPMIQGAFGLMQEEICIGPKIKRSEIVEIKKTIDSEYDIFPGKAKHLVTLVEEGNCGSFTKRKFYLERDFLLVTNGIKGLPKDGSGKWSAWPLEFVYNEETLPGMDKSYDDLAEATGLSGWFLILMSTTTMEENDRGLSVWPRNEDHYYFEFE